MLLMLVPAITLLALLGSGLMAGLFFAYSNSVMPALAKLPGPQGITMMNHINVVIQNPLFLTIFMGTAVLALALAVAALAGWTVRPAWILIGAVLYLAGNIAVTIAINVPMNDALAVIGANDAGSEAFWTAFLDRWVFWNHVRSAACTGAMVAFAMAMK